MKFNQNQSMNEGDKAMTKFFSSKNSDCGLDLSPGANTVEVVQDVVIPNIYMKLILLR